MHSEIISEVAAELNLTEEEVTLVIKAMEDLVLKNIRRSTYDDVYSTRILGFGTFGSLPEKVIKKLKQRTLDKI